ncbi:RelA/SpoT family protein [Candidatus Margulisiibacteriota bacterium]
MEDITCEKLIEKVKQNSPDADLELIRKAFEFSKTKHKDQKRHSGDPYITHPLHVAEILADREQDESTIVAALLHDTVEDGVATKEELQKLFGEEIMLLVEGVTKLGQLVFESREVRQAENFRKMFLAMGEDIRVIVIKLADRLHNMMTLQYLPPEKQIETSLETKEIFAPLAHRLGMWDLKWRLEDLSFSFLEPDKFKEIRDKIVDRREQRETYITEFINKLQDILGKVSIKYEVIGRPKHFYSIYRKMVGQNLEFEDLYDLLAVRIIVENVKDCYAVLGIIHATWKPIPGRFHDYIAMPKSNGYRSLHTTVISDFGKPVEIQIRTGEMHKIAEYGIAAHWRYKEGGESKDFDQKMAWLRSILEWQGEMKDAKDFLERLKIDLFEDEVFVFTPKGSVYSLPIGSTPIDFAYRIHTEIGHRCIGSKVSGKIVPLSYRLKNGDIVEIVVGKVDNPSMGWLNFIKTSAARARIKAFFKKQKREDNAQRGRKLLEEELEKLMLQPSKVLIEEVTQDIVKEYAVADFNEILVMVGYGELSAYKIARGIRKVVERKQAVPPLEEEVLQPTFVHEPKVKPKKGVKVVGLDNVLVKFANCCRPIPGEEILGFVTKGKGVAVHRHDCFNIALMKQPPSKFVKVEWSKDEGMLYPVEIEVEAFDRVGVLRDILDKITETKTNVSAANISTKKGTIAILTMIIDVTNIEHFKKVMVAIRKVSDVYDVYRMGTNKSKAHS